MTTRRTLLTAIPLIAFGAAGRVWANPTVLRPEAFGAGRGDVVRDTAAWVALAAAARGQPDVVVEARGIYRIAGSLVSFKEVGVLRARLAGARFHQTERLSRTLSFESCGVVEIHDGRFEGLGGAAGEFAGASSSWNGVAAVYFDECDTVRVRRTQEIRHAGGGFVVIGGRVRDFEAVISQGIGAPWIDPVGQGNQGNGSDCSIMCVPKTFARGWIYEHRFVGNRCWDHAFGIQAVQSRSCVFQGNEIGPCPGQHGVYGIENDGVEAVDNTFRQTRQLGFKEQLENYAGRYIGAEWVSGADYASGDLVRRGERLFECIRRHTSGRAFTPAYWRVSYLNFRRGGIFEANRIEACGHGFGHMSTTLVDGKEIFTNGWRVRDNAFEAVRSESVYVQRALDAEITGNRIDTQRKSETAAIYLTEFGGVVRANTVIGAGHAAILCSVATTVRVEDNVIFDSGLNGRVADQQAGVTFFEPVAHRALPSSRGRRDRRAIVRGNEVRWSQSRPAGGQPVVSADRHLNIDVSPLS
ncbi:MAG: hypothetical protein K2X07_08305 [Caulobacteraceae bacterium]|nr:hypothetical protein [Caulobacteraceae bacterium]